MRTAPVTADGCAPDDATGMTSGHVPALAAAAPGPTRNVQAHPSQTTLGRHRSGSQTATGDPASVDPAGAEHGNAASPVTAARGPNRNGPDHRAQAGPHGRRVGQRPDRWIRWATGSPPWQLVRPCWRPGPTGCSHTPRPVGVDEPERAA